MKLWRRRNLFYFSVLDQYARFECANSMNCSVTTAENGLRALEYLGLGGGDGQSIVNDNVGDFLRSKYKSTIVMRYMDSFTHLHRISFCSWLLFFN